MLGRLLILGIVGLTYGRPQDAADVLAVPRVPDVRCQSSEGRFLIQHENDCTKYYICDNRLRNFIPSDCNLGTHFSQKLQDCVDPRESECEFNKDGGESENVVAEDVNCICDQIEEEDCDDDNTGGTNRNSNGCVCGDGGVGGEVAGGDGESGGGDVESGNGGGGNGVGETLPNGCPADFDIHHLLPHEDDDTKYYQCVFGEKVERPCAPCTRFNFTEQGCVHSWDLECESSNEENDSNGDGGNGGGGSGGDGGNGGSGGGGGGNGVGETLPNGCPADFDIHHLLPYEDDDTKYYQCVFGEKVLRPCGPCTRFNFTEQGCVHSWDSECQPDNGDNDGNGGGGNGGGGNGGGSDNGGSGGGNGGSGVGETLPNGCPADFDIHHLLPHENDETKYYQCVFGEKVERPCGPCTRFDFTEQGCVHSWDSECQPDNGDNDGNGGGGNGGGGSGGGGNGGSGGGNGGNGVGVTLPNGCPADFHIHHLLPHETYCDKYYQCNFGNKVLRPCGPATQFSFVLQNCVHPNISDCGSVNGDGGTGGGGDGGSGGGDGGSGGGDGGNGIGVTLPNGCPADFHIHHLLPHETDCDKYYQCNFGNKVLRPCGPATQFSFALQNCVHPNISDCGSVNGDGGTGEGGDGGNGGGDGGNGGGDSGNGGGDGGNGDGDGGNGGGDGGNGGGDGGNGDGDGGNGGGDGGNGGGDSGNGGGDGGNGDGDGGNGGGDGGNGGGDGGNGGGDGGSGGGDGGSGGGDGGSGGGDGGSGGGDGGSGGGDGGSGGGDGGSGGGEGGSGGGDGGSGGGDGGSGGGDGGNGGGDGGNGGGDGGNGGGDGGSGGGDGGSGGGDGGSGGGDGGSGGGDGGNGIGVTLPNGCPADFHIHHLLPHETDCAKYYQCNFGEKVLRPCGIGTQFSTIEQGCVHPKDSDCGVLEGGEGGEGGGDCNCGDNGNGNGDEDCDGDNGNGDGCNCGEGGDGGNGGGDGGNGDGDGGNGGGDGGNGGGDGGNGGGDGGSGGGDGGSGGGDGGSGGGDEGSGGGDGGGDGGSGGGDGGSGGGDGGNGGGDGGSGGVGATDRCKDECHVSHWAHETDCDKFWRCEGNRKVLGICSEGLHFNERTQTCDFKCNVMCIRETVQSTAERDGLKIFLPWEKVDKIIELAKHDQMPTLNLIDL